MISILIFRTSLSSTEVAELYNSGSQAEADETTNIKFIPHTEFTEDNEEVLLNHAPSAQGCFLLYLDFLKHRKKAASSVSNIIQ